MVTFIHKERLNGTEVPRLACIERTEVAEFSASRISSYKNWTKKNLKLLFGNILRILRLDAIAESTIYSQQIMIVDSVFDRANTPSS